MKINISKATFSSIVGIGQKVKKAALETGDKYLELNRGVNAVTNIDLTEVIKKIDFNSKELQVYAPNLGIESLRKSIVKEYFPNIENIPNIHNNVSITPGGMPRLNIKYLKDNNLLVDDVYGGNIPIGIFAVINKSEDFLFQHKIGAVGLDKFVYYDKDTWSSYSRICVSVDHELFKEFISKII